jgi:hypothetical protein
MPASISIGFPDVAAMTMQGDWIRSAIYNFRKVGVSMPGNDGPHFHKGDENPQAPSENTGPAGQFAEFLAGSRERHVETAGSNHAEEVSEQMMGRIDQLIDLTRIALGISTEKP